jgi:hypothetical protein
MSAIAYEKALPARHCLLAKKHQLSTAQADIKAPRAVA